jgi:hypothetical protein
MSTPSVKVKNTCRGCQKYLEADQRLVCSRCEQARYCSRQCQKAHWKQHKKECKACIQNNAKLSAKLRQVNHDQNEQGEGEWVYRPHHISRSEQKDTRQAWAAAMPKRDYIAPTAEETMRRLGMTASFLQGLAVGDWLAVKRRMVAVGRPVQIQNDPPLKAGDYIEVVAGNDVKWETVGQRGIIVEFSRRDKKWGIEFDEDCPGLVLQGNLRRIEPEPEKRDQVEATLLKLGLSL